MIENIKFKFQIASVDNWVSALYKLYDVIIIKTYNKDNNIAFEKQRIPITKKNMVDWAWLTCT